MKLTNYFFLTFLIFGVLETSFAQTKETLPVEEVVKLAEQQYGAYIEQYPDSSRYPVSTNPDNSLKTGSAGSWTSGFFPGSLWYLYRFTDDLKWRKAAVKWTQSIESQKENTGTHDLGFMIFNSFGNGFELTRNPEYREILLQGAKSLSTRFDSEVGAIKSWDNPKFSYPVIIDNLMNLEYLFWATRASGDSTFYDIAVKHAETDLKYRFREDSGSFHVLDFNPENGELLRRMTHQGYADSTTWARGQAWGIYGYTVLYRETGDKKYLDQAKAAADYFLNQTDEMPDHIPYWDFQAPNIPYAEKDASAAAIASSAMIELNKYANKEDYYLEKAEEILKSLCSSTYLAEAGTNNFFLLKHSVGHMPEGYDVDVPINYADYYFLEALWRYQNYSNFSHKKND